MRCPCPLQAIERPDPASAPPLWWPPRGPATTRSIHPPLGHRPTVAGGWAARLRGRLHTQRAGGGCDRSPTRHGSTSGTPATCITILGAEQVLVDPWPKREAARTSDDVRARRSRQRRRLRRDLSVTLDARDAGSWSERVIRPLGAKMIAVSDPAGSPPPSSPPYKPRISFQADLQVVSPKASTRRCSYSSSLRRPLIGPSR